MGRAKLKKCKANLGKYSSFIPDGGLGSASAKLAILWSKKPPFWVFWLWYFVRNGSYLVQPPRKSYSSARSFSLYGV